MPIGKKLGLPAVAVVPRQGQRQGAEHGNSEISCHRQNFVRCYTSSMALAAYAMHDGDSAGRRFPERQHPYRSEYQRDRDRIIHTKAFRRLERKTQVFSPAYSDHFRNRLTHTLEVSQIARTVSAALGLNTDLCEVLALSHDIGHPPFSHDGEEVLNRLMHECGSGFEHNLHALRIIEDFEEKYASFRGLNLTFEVREGVVKHSRDYAREDTTYVDISEYRKGDRPPLEAQLIDLTDEIAYNSADLDDGYDSGLLSVDQICRQVNLFRELYQEVQSAYGDAAEAVRVSETVRRLIDVLATSLIRETRSLIESNQIESVEAVRAFPGRLAGFEAEIAAKNQQLKQFLRAHLYTHPALKKAREDARSLIEGLFCHYVDYPQRLPEGHHSRIGALGVHRVVCDYIAGMTDSYARSRYAASSKHTIA